MTKTSRQPNEPECVKCSREIAPTSPAVETHDGGWFHLDCHGRYYCAGCKKVIYQWGGMAVSVIDTNTFAHAECVNRAPCATVG